MLREAVGGQLLGTLAPRNLCYFSHVRQKKTGDSLQKDHPKKMKWSRKPSWCKGYARQCRHSKMAVSRHLGCYRTGNSAIRSADPEYPCVEPNMEWIGCTVFGIFAFKLYCDLESGVRCQLKVIPSGTIGSADPKNLTLEANITSIGKTVAKLWPFLYIQDGRQPPSWILSNRK